MRPLISVSSRALVLAVANVDTDVITPMKRLMERSAQPLSHYAFESLRYLGGDADSGELNPDFCFNQPGANGAEILLVGPNFGCGSSRESAPKAIADLGIRTIIGPSFGDIFFNNCFQQGVLPIALNPEVVRELSSDAGPLTVDLEALTISTTAGMTIPFDCNARRRRCLLAGLDDIGLTLASHRDDIARFQQAERSRRPWLHPLA